MPNKPRNRGKNAKSFKPNIVNFCFNSLSFLSLVLQHIVSFGKRNKTLAYISQGLNTYSMLWIQIIKGKPFLGFWYTQINTKQYFHPVRSNLSSYRCSLSTVCLQSKYHKKKKNNFPHVSRSVLRVGSPISHTFSHSFTFFCVK